MGFTRLAHTTAIGKVLLAAAPDEDPRRLPRGAPPGALHAAAPWCERRHIKRHLRVVRERGIGKDLEELAEGCCCVAVPVLDARGDVLGAIGLSTPAHRWRTHEAALTELCCEIGARASNELGLRPSTAR